jgi:hypothetical protein
MSEQKTETNAREPGFYWVHWCGDPTPIVAEWGDNEWNFPGAESVGYAESDDPGGTRVRVVSERLQPPTAGMSAPGGFEPYSPEERAVIEELKKLGWVCINDGWELAGYRASYAAPPDRTFEELLR